MDLERTLGGRFRLVRLLGAGAMGEVWKAQDERLGRAVAVKLIRPEFAQLGAARERFTAEALAAARLTHAGIAQIFDAGDDKGTAWMALELCDGEPLSAVLARERRLPATRAIALVSQVLAALAEAHARGIVHRDVKPENVMVSRGADGEERTKLLDFGVAKLLETTGSSARTADGQVIGTPFYLAPEQARGQAVGPPADLYAVGVMLYELLTGRVPFAQEQTTAVLLAHVMDAPVPPTTAAPEAGIPLELEEQVLRAMAKHPADRPPSAAAFRTALLSIGRALAPAQAPSASGRGDDLGTLSGAGRASPGFHAGRLAALEGPPAPSAARVSSGGAALFEMPALTPGTAVEEPLELAGPTPALRPAGATTGSGRKAARTLPAVGRARRVLPIVVGVVLGLGLLGVVVALGVRGFADRDDAEVSTMISVSSTPPGAEVWIEHELLGATPYEEVLAYPEGQIIELRLSLDGHEPWFEPVKWGEPVIRKVKLKKTR